MQQKHEERVAERLEEIRAGTYEEAVGDAGCSGDCEGHEAGWTYAREHDGDLGTACDDPDPATASAFVQGCQAYLNAGDEAEEQVREEEKGGRVAAARELAYGPVRLSAQPGRSLQQHR